MSGHCYSLVDVGNLRLLTLIPGLFLGLQSHVEDFRDCKCLFTEATTRGRHLINAIDAAKHLNKSIQTTRMHDIVDSFLYPVCRSKPAVCSLLLVHATWLSSPLTCVSITGNIYNTKQHQNN